MTVTGLNNPEMHLYHKAVTYCLLQLVCLVSTGKVCFASQDSLLSVKVAEKKGHFL